MPVFRVSEEGLTPTHATLFRQVSIRENASLSFNAKFSLLHLFLSPTHALKSPVVNNSSEGESPPETALTLAVSLGHFKVRYY